MIQLAQAKALANPQQGSGEPQKKINISLSGMLSPEAAAELAGVESVASPTDTAGGTAAIPGRQPAEVPGGGASKANARALEAGRTARANGAPPNMNADNQPGGVNPPTQPGDSANPAGRTGPAGPGRP
jgi:hypothetical protein